MAQSRSDMADILRELHGIQLEAFNIGVHSFEINIRTQPLEDEGEGMEGLIRKYGDTDERYLTVYVFLRGDDSDEDYGRWGFYQDESIRTITDHLIEIRKFIGRVQD